MADFIVIVIVAAIVCSALLYIRKEKKRGVHCIGCPAAGQCSKNHGTHSPCGCSSQKQK